MSYRDRIIADLGGQVRTLPPIDDEYSIGLEFAAGPGLDRPIQIDVSKVYPPKPNSIINVHRTIGFIHNIDVPQEPSAPIVMHVLEAEGRGLIHPNFAASMGLGYTSVYMGVGVTISDNPDIRTSLGGIYAYGKNEMELQMFFGAHPNIPSTIEESTAATITNAVARLIGPHMFRGLPRMRPGKPSLKVTMSCHKAPSLIVDGIQDLADFDINTGNIGLL